MRTAPDNVAYDLAISFPAMEFTARVARRGRYSAPIMDELVIRVVDAAGEITLASLGGLLRLTGAQLDSFTEPMLRSGLLRVTEGGLLALGSQGRQAMLQAAGEPPKLSRVEEATERCTVDVFDNAFSFRPLDWKQPARYVEIAPVESADRNVIREIVRHKLLDDYFEHLLYLELYGFRAAAPKRIEYVIDLDDGWGERGQLSARVLLDERGVASLEYPDLRSADQLQRRRNLIAVVDSVLARMKASVPALSQQTFIDLARSASHELQLDDSAEAIREQEYWMDDGVLVTGRLESRSRSTADEFVDRVIAESGLMRGGKERTLQWLLVLIPEPELFLAGRAYRTFLDATISKIRRRSPKIKVVAVAAHLSISRLDKTLGSLFNAHVSTSSIDQSLAALDGVFIPDEMAYVACADVPSSLCPSPDLPRPRSFMTTRLDAVREVTRRVFASLVFSNVTLDGVSATEWSELLASLKKLGERKEARVLRLRKKKAE